MKLGDVLEIIAALFVVGAVLLATGEAWAALAAAAVCLGYEAQCYAHTDLRRKRPDERAKRK